MTFDACQKLDEEISGGCKSKVTSLCVLAGPSSTNCLIVAGVTLTSESEAETKPCLAVFDVCWPTPAPTAKTSSSDQSGTASSGTSSTQIDKKVGGSSGTTKKVMPPSLMHHVIVANHHQGVAGNGGGTAANSITAPGNGADGGGGSGASLANNLFFSFGYGLGYGLLWL